MPTRDIDLIDQLSQLRALLNCAFMACTAIDDDVHGVALQSLLSLIEARVEALSRGSVAGPVLV